MVLFTICSLFEQNPGAPWLEKRPLNYAWIHGRPREVGSLGFRANPNEKGFDSESIRVRRVNRKSRVFWPAVVLEMQVAHEPSPEGTKWESRFGCEDVLRATCLLDGGFNFFRFVSLLSGFPATQINKLTALTRIKKENRGESPNVRMFPEFPLGVQMVSRSAVPEICRVCNRNGDLQPSQ